MSEHAQLPNLRARVELLERTLRDIRDHAMGTDLERAMGTLAWISDKADEALGDE